ncbi:MAG: hypothetical protein L0H59_03570 [Tomitella sp.]|nr:hypothetical protein [Tomitella sp.]
MGQSPATRRELMMAARMVDVAAPAMPLPRLIRLSAAHYNARNPGKRAADYSADERFMARICVNYLRHQGTHYDHDRDFVSAHASAADRAAVGAIIKGRVLAAIAETYPQLAAEAYRQAQREDLGRPHSATSTLARRR